MREEPSHATLPSFVIYLCAGRRCLCARLPCPKRKSNGFATCETGEIIDAQALSCKVTTLEEKRNCQRRFSVPWSWPWPWPWSRTGHLGAKPGHHKHPTARSHPRLPRPHMSLCQYQYRPAPAVVAVCCCDHAGVLRPKVKANCGSLWSCLQASCSHADESSTQALPKSKLSSGSRHHQRTRISRELT